MSCFRLVTTIAVLFTSSLTATSFAQRGDRRGLGRSIDKPTLLSVAEVRDELTVNEEQAEKINVILVAYREESRALFSSLRDLSREERQGKRKERMKRSAELLKKCEASLDSTLDESQVRRLNEIALQQQGVKGLLSDYCRVALKLSDGQIETIRAAITSGDEERRTLVGGRRRGLGRGDGSAEEIRERIEAIRKKTEEEVLALLSEEQREGFDRLKGESFELDRRVLFRGRGAAGGAHRRGGDSKRERRPPVESDV